MQEYISTETAILFKNILVNEYHIRDDEWSYLFFSQHVPNYVFLDVKQLFEIIKASTLPKTFLGKHLRDIHRIYESVGAHVNLVQAILDRAIDDFYFFHKIDTQIGPERFSTDELSRYTREEIREAVMIYNLPKNKIYDWPEAYDSSSSARKRQLQQELNYVNDFCELYSHKSPEFKRHVVELVKTAHEKDSLIGQFIYLASKTAEIITVLSYDKMGLKLRLRINSNMNSRRSRVMMRFCDYKKDGYCKVSELMIMDFFKVGRYQDYDRTGYFTSLIIMSTILVNDEWYHWREKTYHNYHHRRKKII